MNTSAILFQKNFAEINYSSQTGHQSKKTVSTSVLPDPSEIPRPFDIDKLKVPDFWETQETDDGEILLNEEQVKQLKDLYVKQRIDQLTEKYTKLCSTFVDRYQSSMEIQ